MDEQTLTYQVKGVTRQQIEQNVSSILEQLKEDESIRGQARSAGVQLDELDAALEGGASAKPIRVGSGAGFVGETAILIYIASHVGTKVLSNVWEKFILPRLEAKYNVKFKKMDPGK